MTSKPLSCNEKTKKTPTSCVFPVKHLLWVEFNINIKPQNISSRALQHFWSHDCAISWQRHVFYNLLLLSLIRPCCTLRPLQTLWTLDFQLVLKFTQNFLVKVVSSSILTIHITHLFCALEWSAERWWPGRQVSGSGRATPDPQPSCPIVEQVLSRNHFKSGFSFHHGCDHSWSLRCGKSL